MRNLHQEIYFKKSQAYYYNQGDHARWHSPLFLGYTNWFSYIGSLTTLTVSV